MAEMTLSDIAGRMKDIDFCMLTSKSADGQLSTRPMSNNRDVEYDGDSWFFAYEDAGFVGDIARDAAVGLSFSGAKSLLGKPGIFIAVAGEATVLRDRGTFAEHWVDDLERWFPQGVETPGMVMIKVQARHLHYWDGEDEGEVAL